MLSAINSRVDWVKRRARRARLFRGDRGVEPISLAIGLLLVAAIIALLVARFNVARNENDQNNTLSGASQLIAAISRTFNGQAYPVGNLFGTLNQVKAYPPGFKVNVPATTVTHPLGGTVVVTGNGLTYDLVFNNLPDDMCVVLAVQTYNQVGLTINGAAQALPMTSAAAAAACTAGADSVDFTLQ
jgi:hypothetical protein